MPHINILKFQRLILERGYSHLPKFVKMKLRGVLFSAFNPRMRL